MNAPRFQVSSLRFKVAGIARHPARLGNLKPSTLNFKPNRLRRAFTLVEILATLGFLGLVIPVAIKAVLMASRAGEISERSMIAEQLGENKLEELMLANAWTSAESRGTFPDRPGYRWEMKRNDWQTGAMTELDLDVFYPVQGHEQSLRLSTLVNELIIPPTPGSTGTSGTSSGGPSL